MKSPAVPAKRFALGCGCKDAKSVSVSASATTPTVARGRSAGGANPWASTTTDTLTSAASSSLWEDAVAELGYKDGGCRMLPESGGSAVSTTPSFSGLLRELSDLERSVAAWGARKQGHRHEDDDKLSPPPMPSRRGKGGLMMRAAKEKEGLEGSVAVVKQSEDPLGDFRRSMLQMIVENGIVAGEDLREMLRRFLTLNAPHHHDAILRAFAEIWDQVFVAASTLGGCGTPGRACSVPRREQGPRTPPRHRRSPQSWRV
ncbi:unnamed protein product [Urochloa decumbens]|uniref:Transcription repressor n=1 Tax=Urochloa decumbens TaxID=240449 RepID=A0ABC9CH75_9POAL